MILFNRRKQPAVTKRHNLCDSIFELPLLSVHYQHHNFEHEKQNIQLSEVWNASRYATITYLL